MMMTACLSKKAPKLPPSIMIRMTMVATPPISPKPVAISMGRPLPRRPAGPEAGAREVSVNGRR
jgi:hypothetical protein